MSRSDDGLSNDAMPVDSGIVGDVRSAGGNMTSVVPEVETGVGPVGGGVTGAFLGVEREVNPVKDKTIVLVGRLEVVTLGSMTLLLENEPSGADNE